MDETKRLQGGVIVQFYNHHFLKRTLLFLVTISVFSFFLCLSSGFSLLPNSFYVYFNTCLFSFLTHTLERKYMFLICNGILAILAKSSISSSFSPNYVPGLDAQLSVVNISSVKPTIPDTASMEDVALVADGEENAHKEKQEEEEEEEKGEILNEEDVGFMDKQEEEEDQGEGNEELISTDELNRRIEDFIRKMKEEIRIEAQRQLIAV